jgi:tetratricopeptide (TPR) repeat protein
MRASTLLMACCFSAVAMAAVAAAPRPATVKEYDRVFTTYPFGDPDPVASAGRIYPYFRFDGFTDRPAPKAWKVVELENDYVQVLILPEIGGKVWAAVEKSTGRSFLYFNHVVKFRDVAMRGPWTSGGIEANYGIMGHAPSCSAPVDYLARTNPDGSASCWIGGLDLITRTTWRVEVRLPADRACFETRSLWHNGTAEEQPCYSWMNVGIKASGNLEIVAPGSHHIGHDGRAHAWPLDRESGRDLSWYERNDFGGPKSYHVVGRFSEFFGGYWHDDDFGMVHVAPYRDKPGRKVWIWGLSREGMIWESLLSDTDGQYVEVQSGRLFNQAAEESTRTPFKHRDFPPYATDTWAETWMPVKGTKGFVSASTWGALNVRREGGRLTVRIAPVRPLQGKLEVLDGDRLLASRDVTLEPMRVVEQVIAVDTPPKRLVVRVGGDKLAYDEQADDLLSRPVEAPARFDWDSLAGRHMRGRESVRLREFGRAEEQFQACLKDDPNDVVALVEQAAQANRRADFAAARDLAHRALAVDTYDPSANFQFGRATAALGRSADAKAAFSIAALAPGWRCPACTELAREDLREHRLDDARAAAEDALDGNRRDLDALQTLACVARLQGDAAAAEAATSALRTFDPLSHFARFEDFLRGKTRRDEVTSLVRNELPHETYLELAAWYHAAGRNDDAARALELAPTTAEVLYWLAYLRRDPALLARAVEASPAFVFPFRPESIPVFEWACSQSTAWPPRYFLALVRWNLGDTAKARDLLISCGDAPTFAPFYAARARVDRATALRDLQRANQLDPAQWRFALAIAEHHARHDDPAAWLAAASDAVRRFPQIAAIALDHARALLANGRFQESADRLDAMHLLPAEGTTAARALHREVHLMRAVECLKSRDFDRSLTHIETARAWPERLGSGKPYPDAIDERLEDYLVAQCLLGRGDSAHAKAALEKVVAAGPQMPSRGIGRLIRALALKQTGRAGEGSDLIRDWLRADPESSLARWADAVYAARKLEPPRSALDADGRVLAGWLK